MTSADGNSPLRDDSPTSEEWSQIDAIFHEVVELVGPEREERLLELTGDDLRLRNEVKSLLVHDQGAVHLPALRTPVEPTLLPLRKSGSDLDRYRLLFPIAVNQASEVWCAEEHGAADSSERVAIKFLRDDSTNDRRLERFRNEATILSQFRHPNIAEFLNCGQDENGVPYIVMRYVSGASITDFADEKTLGIDDRLRLMIRVCDAVSYAHRYLVVHRDLKPSNILVTSQRQPVILDFGISKTISEDVSDSTELSNLTTTNQRPMTPAYASPEQVHGEPVTTATDVYALGLVLYELISGHHPYSEAAHPNQPRLLDRICNATSRKPSDVVSEVARGLTDQADSVPKAPRLIAALRDASEGQLQRRLRGSLDGVTMRALSKSPAERYGSVAELRKDLDNVLHYRPVAAKFKDDRLRAAIRQRPMTSLILGVLASGLLIAAAMGWMSWQKQKQVAQQLAESQVRAKQAATNARVTSDSAEAARSARELIAKGEYERGERQLAELQPKSPIAFYDAALAFQQLGKPTQAMRMLESASSSEESLALRLRLLLDANRLNAAEQFVDETTDMRLVSTTAGALAVADYRKEIGWSEGAIRLLDELEGKSGKYELSTDQLLECRLLRAQLTNRLEDLDSLLENTSTRPGPLAVRGKALLAHAGSLVDKSKPEVAIEKLRAAVDNFATTSPDHVVAFQAMLALCEIDNNSEDDLGLAQWRDHAWSRVTATGELGTEVAAWCAINKMRYGNRETQKQIIANFERDPVVLGNPYLERQFLLYEVESHMKEERWANAHSALRRLCDLEKSLWKESSIEYAYVAAAHAHALEKLGEPSANALVRRVKIIVSELLPSLPDSRARAFLRPVSLGTQAAMPDYQWINLYSMHRGNTDEDQRSMLLHIQDEIKDEFPEDADLLQPGID